MIIKIVKRPDGSGVLRCVRDDGSETWQKLTKYAAHFAFHDLTHFAVETVLGCSEGFFGLIAAGWEVEDTTGKERRGPLPSQARDVEQIVGLFDSERGSCVLWTMEEWNLFAPRALSSPQIQSIHKLRNELFQRWFAVESGGTLELEFNPQAKHDSFAIHQMK